MAVTTARERNALRVLDYLFREGPARRVDVIRATALSRATVSKLIGELQAQGLVAEERPALAVAGRSGRPPTLLTLNPKIGAFGGVDFGHNSVRVAIADVTGTLLAEDRLDLDVDNAAELAIAAAVDRLAGAGRRGRSAAQAAARRRRRDLRAGPARRGERGRRGDPAGLERRLAAARAGAPPRACRCTSATTPTSARSPRCGPAPPQGASDVVYVMLSSGVGGGLVLDGSLFTGHSGMTGELGHVQVDPEGALCRCGNRGCLETVAGAQALLARLRPVLGKETGLAEAVERAHAGDELLPPGVPRGGPGGRAGRRRRSATSSTPSW